ncbi:ATP-dependent HslUV protease ATP-binding subunit HslU [Pasteurella skyensis]|uniref:ATP-dependent HslUV protease ATP-binding subunit HslU n=1 Tax=Phocoenobacter skyensis TaxID=97481 RepID=A0A1H7WMY8_9PAST|nr:ATP-dependent HslUV protease ATP-binding subunit HslU [Pasteurella skyensis]
MDMSKRSGEKIVIDQDFVAKELDDVVENEDLSHYVL